MENVTVVMIGDIGLEIVLRLRNKENNRCLLIRKVSKGAKIRNRYNQVPHLTQDTNGKVTNSQKTPQTRAKRSALSQQVTTGGLHMDNVIFADLKIIGLQIVPREKKI